MLIQPRIVAKWVRPKQSPTRAHVTELMPSPNENKTAKKTIGQRAPSLYISTARPRAPRSTPKAPILCFECRSPSHPVSGRTTRSEEHTSELQSRPHLVCRLLLEKKKKHRDLSPT